jgi:hypothetical protein
LHADVPAVGVLPGLDLAPQSVVQDLGLDDIVPFVKWVSGENGDRAVKIILRGSVPPPKKQ